MSFLSKFGNDVKAVFGFLASPKGQAVVASTEVVGEAVATAAGFGLPVQAGLTLFNNWYAEIFKAQALAAAAAASPGVTTNEAKAAMVLQSMTPQVLQFAQANGLPAPTAASLAIINTSLVNALNALGAGTAPVIPASFPAATPAAALAEAIAAASRVSGPGVGQPAA